MYQNNGPCSNARKEDCGCYVKPNHTPSARKTPPKMGSLWTCLIHPNLRTQLCLPSLFFLQRTNPSELTVAYKALVGMRVGGKEGVDSQEASINREIYQLYNPNSNACSTA